MITAARVAVGSIVLTLLLTVQVEKPRYGLPERSSWRYLPDFIVIGFFDATLPCLLIAWAQKQLPSSITAILLGTVPLFATLLEACFIKDHPVSWKKIGAILLGFFGVLVLVGPALLVSGNMGALSFSLPLMPVLALLFSALCFAISVSLIKGRLGNHVPPLHAAQGIIVGATITALPLMLWITKPWTTTFVHPSNSAIIALIWLGIFGGGIVYTLYVRLINRAGPSFASTGNYLALPIGAFIGIVFAGEKLTLNVIASLVLILVALWLSSGKKK